MPVVNPNATNTLVTASTPEAVIGFQPLSQPATLAQSGIPMIVPSTGTLTAAGALSGITALATTYTNGCYMFFPANAIATSSAAGMRFVKMTSTTAGTVFQNLYTSGTPTIPLASALIPCTSASSYTQTTASQLPAVTVTIPANSMGLNGRITVEFLGGNNNSAGAKTFTCNFAGTGLFSLAPTTNQHFYAGHVITNSGIATVQQTQGTGNLGYSTGAGASLQMTIDTTADVSLTLNGNLAVATDTMQFTSFFVQLVPQ